MRNLFILSALLLFSATTFVGCGSNEPTVAEPVSADDGVMDEEHRKMYEESMKKGGSSRPGN